jgi:hypothetical protein
MKKYIIFCLLVIVFLPETTQATPSISTDNQALLRRKKPRPYRKKKGFLWGLFKGRNSCDCPKH